MYCNDRDIGGGIIVFVDIFNQTVLGILLLWSF